MHLDELGAYKQTLLTRLAASREIIGLLLNSEDSASPEASLNDVLLPYLHYPDPQNDPKTYICTEVSVPKVLSTDVKRLNIRIYIFTHQSLMHCPDGGDYKTRPDMLSSVIDRIINTSSDFGFTRLKLESARRYFQDRSYTGYILTYSTSDFN